MIDTTYGQNEISMDQLATVGGGWNLTGDSFVSTSQIEAGYRFHFNDRLSLGANYAWVSNRWTAAAHVASFRSRAGASICGVNRRSKCHWVAKRSGSGKNPACRPAK